jgi:hypothetical protein
VTDYLTWASAALGIKKSEAVILVERLVKAGYITSSEKDQFCYTFVKDDTTNVGSVLPGIGPSNSGVNVSFMEFSVQEIAKQMTVYEYYLFCRISPNELARQAWNRPDAEVVAPNLYRFIQSFNRVKKFHKIRKNRKKILS